MVTSTPLVKSTEPIKDNPTNMLKQNKGTNSLFNAGASVVKHHPSDLRQDRILLTPMMNSPLTFDKRTSFSVSLVRENTTGNGADKLVPSSNPKLPLSKDASVHANFALEQQDASDDRLIEMPSVAVAPKTLHFELSPSKPKNQTHSSIDMFENFSTYNEGNNINVNKNKEDIIQDNQSKDLSVKIIKVSQLPSENQSATDCENPNNNQPTTADVQFRVPSIKSHPHLIQIKKGGKNWRRTMALSLNALTSNEGNNRIISERKSVTRKSCFIIEPKRSTVTLDNNKISQINEISIMDVSASQPVEINEKVTDEHTDFNCSGANPEVSLLNSIQANKSASYIVPCSRPNDSILAVSNIDTVTKVLSKCSEKKIISFDTLCNDNILSNSKKVGEGSYGEVFLLNHTESNSSVLKIVPVDGNALVNGELQTKLSDMLAEIVVSTDLNNLQEGFHVENMRFEAPNFISLRSCSLVEGYYPAKLLELWDDYNQMKGSENDRPDAKLFNNENSMDIQRFVALEYENGGQDLETIAINNAKQGLSIFLQVAYSVAGKFNRLFI